MLGTGGVASAAGKPTLPLDPIGFEVQASNGYTAIVGDAPDGVTLNLFGRKASAYYGVSQDSATPRSIDADFGEEGSVHMNFVPTGGYRIVRSACFSDRQFRMRRGKYVGSFDFEGADGFASVRRRAVSARPSRFLLDFGCGGFVGESTVTGPPGPGMGSRLTATSDRGSDYFTVYSSGFGEKAQFSSVLTEETPKLYVSREVHVTAPPGTFRRSRRHTTASVRPPAPFNGSAKYERVGRRDVRWAGSLRVDFPGRPDVPLTGEDFEASLLSSNVTVFDESFRRSTVPPQLRIPAR